MRLPFGRRQTDDASPDADRQAVSVGRSRIGGPSGCMALFFGIFLLAGLSAMFPFLLAGWGMIDSLGWQQVDCEVISSRVDVSSDSDGDTYRPEIHYRYRFEGREYESDRYDFFLSTTHSSGRRGKERVVERYPAGARCLAWVDPDEPGRAVLHRGPSWAMAFVLLPLVFVVVGGGGVALGMGWWQPSALRSRGRRAALSTAVETKAPAPTTPTAGAIVLEPAVGPIAKLAGTLFVALFWNGIVGLFVYLLWKDWSNDVGGWLMALFLVPFVLIGLLLVGMVPYVLLQSFNPRATLEIAGGPLRVGDEVHLSWRFRGRVARLRNLGLRLRGQESATYTVGTDSRTKTSIFCDQPVFQSPGPVMPFGSATLRIPADTMHSFDGGNNRIEWSLVLSGEIPRWPDLEDSYPLDVGPTKGEPDDGGW